MKNREIIGKTESAVTNTGNCCFTRMRAQNSILTLLKPESLISMDFYLNSVCCYFLSVQPCRHCFDVGYQLAIFSSLFTKI